MRTVNLHLARSAQGFKIVHSVAGRIPEKRLVMTTNVGAVQKQITGTTSGFEAARGLALIRLTMGAMFLWVFFENLGKGLYTPAGYAGLINYYIKASHAPGIWKSVMGLAASHASM